MEGIEENYITRLNILKYKLKTILKIEFRKFNSRLSIFAAQADLKDAWNNLWVGGARRISKNWKRGAWAGGGQVLFKEEKVKLKTWWILRLYRTNKTFTKFNVNLI